MTGGGGGGGGWRVWRVGGVVELFMDKGGRGIE